MDRSPSLQQQQRGVAGVRAPPASAAGENGGKKAQPPPPLAAPVTKPAPRRAPSAPRSSPPAASSLVPTPTASIRASASDGAIVEFASPPPTPLHHQLVPLSTRAVSVVERINRLVTHCHYYQCLAGDQPPPQDAVSAAAAKDWTGPPSEEDQVTYEVLLSLYGSAIGPLFMGQPELSLSNRACVLATPDFARGEVIAGYTISAAFVPGTIGRSHFASRKDAFFSSSAVTHSDESSSGTAGATEGKKVPPPLLPPSQQQQLQPQGAGSSTIGTPSLSFSLAEAKARKSAIHEKDSSTFGVMKSVCFRLRKAIVKAVIAEQCQLSKLKSDLVPRIIDVLKDEYLEKVIIITPFQPRGNLGPAAGRLDDDPDRFCRISLDVAAALALMHSRHIYHHNLKLENILETPEGGWCVADAGFSRLFTSQCVEALIFNGELACLAPEVFDPLGPYNTAELPKLKGGAAARNGGVASPAVAKVDVWGFGVLLYRLAYGRDPVEIAMRLAGDVRELILTHEAQFPPKPLWPFHDHLVDVMKACFQKLPERRPTMAELVAMPFFQLLGVMPTDEGLVSTPRSVALASVASDGSHPHLHPHSSFARQSHRSTTGSGGTGYTVDAMLGRGHVSETMLVHQRRNPLKRFAFKMLKRSVLHRVLGVQDSTGSGARRLSSNPVTEARVHEVMRQLATCRKLHHPNLVSYVDIVDGRKGRCFVVQDYIKNGPLVAMPRPDSGPSREPNLEALLSDVLLGLVALHDNGVAHLSLRPSNIFYDDATGRFRLADFGPLFITAEEIACAQAKGRPLYSLPQWLLAEVPLAPIHIDTCCVGLLAASMVPAVFWSVWHDFVPGGHRGATVLDYAELLVTVRAAAGPTAVKPLPPPLVDFITTALGTPTTARALLEHAYFRGRYHASAIPIAKVDVTAEEISVAVQARCETRDEQRLADVLGQDLFQESQILSTTNDTYGGGGGTDSIASADDPALSIDFTGDDLRCTQCRAEMTIALYRCSDCPDVFLCGKCSIADAHHPGHNLVPFVIHTIERGRSGGGNCAQLCHPSSIQDVHALETLEMGANFPVGALSAHVANQRAMERSMARIGPAGCPGTSHRLLFGQQDLGDSATTVADTDCSSSTSPRPAGNSTSNVSNGLGAFICAKDSFTSGFGAETTSATASVYGGAGFGNSPRLGPLMSGILPGGGGLLLPSSHSTPSGGGLAAKFMGKGGGLLAGKNGKKLVLPKAEDLDDLPWEEELRHCRENEHTELLLFNYGFDEVPHEIFTPPPLQVVLLDLSQNNLRSLPHEISFLAHLRKLIVSYNKLTELPDSLGTLVELESIDASHNKLTDLPMTFIYLQHLQSCAMDYNCFSAIPECLLDIIPQNGVMDSSGGCGPPSNGSDRLLANHRPPNAGDVIPSSDSGQFSDDLGPEEEDDEGTQPALKVLYLAANDRIVALPDIERLRRFRDLKIALDNEPSLYRYYMENDLGTKLPNVSVAWNKIYPDEIIPNLYCGSLRSAQSQMVYKKLHIGYVLTVGRGLMPQPPEGGKHKTIVVDDIPGADIMMSMAEAIDFIDEAQQEESGCLVHCFAGLSRSATTVIAYLMARKSMRLDKAYLCTKKGRPAILPNGGFFGQLVRLDGELFPDDTRPLDVDSLDRPTD